jgi:mono/diheme cytochrome c family protein
MDVDMEQTLHPGSVLTVTELGARRFYTLKATTQNGLRLHFLGNCVACHGQFDVVVTGPVPRTRALPRYCGNCRFSGGNGDE